MFCQNCQPLILDHIYGLLDEPDAIAVEKHLRECPSCAAARTEAARVQGMLARAARGTYPQVKFEPPAAQPAVKTSGSTRTVPIPAAPIAEPAPIANALASSGTPAGQSPRLSFWLAWAIAASVLLAIPGTVIPVMGIINRAELAHKATEYSVAIADIKSTEKDQAAESRRKNQEDALNKFASAKQLQENLLTQWVAEEKTLIQTLATRKMSVDVFKPAAVQPGAPNEFMLVLHDHGLAPNSRLLAEVRDQTDAVIFSKRLNVEQHENRHVIRLPADTWTKLNPQSELFLVVSSVDDKTLAKTELQGIRLFGPVYSTMLVTDRATYKPGEMVYFRSLTLDRITFQPPAREQNLLFELQGGHMNHTYQRAVGGTDLVRIHDGKVEPVLGPDGKSIRGIGCGAFYLPTDLPDGDYTLQVRELPHPSGHSPLMPAPVVRSIRVRSGAVDNYTKLVGFSATSYSPGDMVEGWAELKFQGQPVSGAVARIDAMADHLQLSTLAAQPTGPDGRTKFRFPLPYTLTRADVRLKVTFANKTGTKTVEETVTERVPIIGRHLFVEFFPEGGALVAGVPCRVYFRATTSTGQAADIRGTITDGRTVLARVETANDPNQPGANRGIGSFTYIPSLGTPVWLKLETPSGAFAPLLDGTPPIAPAVVAGLPAAVAARAGFMLPTAIADGVVMSVVNPITNPGEPIRVQLQSKGRSRNLIVGAYTRGRLSDTKRISTEPGQLAVVELMGNADPRGGVVRVTVFEEPAEQVDAPVELKQDLKPDIKPIAERLVFRKPGERLQLSFATTDTRTGAAGSSFAANCPVELSLAATDEKGKPTAAIVWAAAVNTGVAPGKKDRLLTTHFLLAGEVSTPDAMEYADFLLTDHPKAAEALDLVLATQGWRQFVEQTSPLEAVRGGIAMDQARLLTNNGQFFTQSEQPGTRDRRRLFESYWPRYEAATQALAKAKAARDAIVADTNEEKHVHDLTLAAEEAQSDAKAARDRARSAAEPVERLRGAGWYGIAGFGLLAVMLGALAFTRPLSRLPYGIGSAGSIGLVAFLVIAIGMAERTQASIGFNEETAKVSHDQDQPLKAASGRTEATNGGERDALAGAAANNTLGKRLAEKRAAAAIDPTGKQGPTAGRMAVPAPGGNAQGGMNLGPGIAGMKPGSSTEGKMPGPPAPAAPGAFGGPPGAPGGLGSSIPATGTPPHVSKADSLKLNESLERLAEQDEKNGWQVREGRKNLQESETLRSLEQAANAPSQLRRAGAQNEKGSSPEFRMKKEAQKAKEYADDRLHLASAPLDEIRLRNSLQHENQDKFAGLGAATRTDNLAYNRVKSAIATIPPLIVREYAPPRPGTTDAESELSDTILWQPVIVLPGDGKAKFTFQLGSAEGGYQIVVAGHTLDGRIGATRGMIKISP